MLQKQKKQIEKENEDQQKKQKKKMEHAENLKLTIQEKNRLRR